MSNDNYISHMEFLQIKFNDMYEEIRSIYCPKKFGVGREVNERIEESTCQMASCATKTIFVGEMRAILIAYSVRVGVVHMDRHRTGVN